MLGLIIEEKTVKVLEPEGSYHISPSWSDNSIILTSTDTDQVFEYSPDSCIFKNLELPCQEHTIFVASCVIIGENFLLATMQLTFDPKGSPNAQWEETWKLRLLDNQKYYKDTLVRMSMGFTDTEPTCIAGFDQVSDN